MVVWVVRARVLSGTRSCSKLASSGEFTGAFRLKAYAGPAVKSNNSENKGRTLGRIPFVGVCPCPATQCFDRLRCRGR